jgi:probable FeS assembly SUF system protein SufT
MPVTNQPITLSRETDVVEVPSGINNKLPAGTIVRVMQNLGTTYTVYSDYGLMYRVDAKDADALGMSNEPAANAPAPEQANEPFSEKMVWDQLKTVYDPEIPVNIADLGLIYSCQIKDLEQGAHRIDIEMSLTAPGCGMGNVLKNDVEMKLAKLPTVREVHVEVVLDPPWGPARMSEAARLQLGLDL